MSYLIKMNTETVLNTIRLIRQLNNEMSTMVDRLAVKVKEIPWEGPSREKYVSNYSSISKRADTLLTEGEMLMLRVNKEVEEWLEVDQRSIQGYKDIRTIIVGVGVAIGKAITDVISYDAKKIEFTAWWITQSIEERKAFLKKLLEDLANKLGFDPIEINFPNLPDPFPYDSRGGYTPSTDSMEIDITNVKWDDPLTVINTLAHEARHKYQLECIKSGIVPEGMTQAQVDTWKTNFESYVRSDFDFEIYENQVIEVDSRAYGEQYANDYLMNEGWK